MTHLRHVLYLAVTLALAACGEEGLSDAERDLARSMALSELTAAPDPTNAYGQNPDAATLGSKLFFDTRFSASGQTACASCHVPEQQFQDGLPLAVAAGTNTRRTMPLAGVAQFKWFFWDGRADSLWSQALGPLENQVEHATDRATVAARFLQHYAADYVRVFGPPPPLDDPPAGGASPLGTDQQKASWNALRPQQQEFVNRVFVNFGKAVAAFETKLRFPQTRFDRAMARSGEGLSRQEIQGLKLFLGKAACVTCHSGPQFSDNHFHNTGVPEVAGLPPDDGRAAVLQVLKQGSFNCLGRYSDDNGAACRELRFMAMDEHVMLRAYKTPSLRGVASRAPYMHAGQFATLEQVLQHYSTAQQAPRGHSELNPLSLDPDEIAALLAFLRTLD